MLLFFLACFFSCEEVIDVELEESKPRLVIEASIFRNKNNASFTQIIRLTTTAPFFSDAIPSAEGAKVSLRDETGNEYLFQENESGYFTYDNFFPEFNTEYQLEVLYKGEVYIATEKLVSVPELEHIVQEDGGGLTGENIEFKAFYTDFPEQGNYYLFRFLHEDLSIQIYDDEFTNGNQTFAFFTDDNLKPGNHINFEIQGISRRFYEYMFILRSQAGSGGGPFQTQPTTVRGNFVNITNPDNYALGYFRLSERDTMEYTVQ